MSKIIHGLCNTNHQNHLLYNASNLCPGCETSEEDFEHVLCCPCPATGLHRTSSLATLRKSLVAMGTPLQLVDVLMHGFQEWLDPAVHSGRCSRSPTFGSLRPADILLTQAYAIQFYSIGWYQLCLGCISRKWHGAVRALLPPTQPHRPLNWGSNLIFALWQFTRSIWDDRNTIVHGADAAESATRTLASL
jgi:hypothetical protein